MLTAMYLRKSRAEEQAPVAETLARHRDALSSYATGNGLTVAAVYEEVASGDSLYGRPEMLRLLSDIERYDAVLCMDIDRLGRGAMHEQGLILEALRTAGVLVVTPGKTYDLNDDMDDSLVSFKALFAREEYKLIKGRLRRGVLKTVQDGGYVANAPYGYRKARVDKRPTLTIDEHEAEGVRMIYSLYAEGQGCQSVADVLHALGYRPRRGERFNRTTIAKIIRNPVYVGKVAWNQCTFKRPKKPGEKHVRTLNPREDWIVSDGRHPAIITPELYETANALLSGRYHPPYRKAGELKNPLAGVLFCGECGKAMVRQPLYGRPHMQPIMLCPTAGCCMASNVDVVEQAFYAMLAALLEDIRAQERSAPAVAPIVDFRAVETAAKAEMSRLRAQLGNLHDLLEQGVYDIDTFLARREDINARMGDAEQVLRNAKPAPDPGHVARELKTLVDAYWDGSPGERNKMIKSVIGAAVYTKPKGSGWKALPRIEFVSLAKNL